MELCSEHHLNTISFWLHPIQLGPWPSYAMKLCWVMEEVSPAHSRTSKYASFSPSRKEQEQQKVGTVEITYLDPVSQKLSNTDVFLDPETWSRRHNEMRFLVSADLVNLVCESHVARQARFRTQVNLSSSETWDSCGESKWGCTGRSTIEDIDCQCHSSDCVKFEVGYQMVKYLEDAYLIVDTAGCLRKSTVGTTWITL